MSENAESQVLPSPPWTNLQGWGTGICIFKQAPLVILVDNEVQEPKAVPDALDLPGRQREP